MARYKRVEGGLYDSEKFRTIPENEGRFWREFESWQGEGNTPDPKDPDPVPTLEERRMARYEEELRKQGITLKGMVLELFNERVTGDKTRLNQLKALKDQVDAEVV